MPDWNQPYWHGANQGPGNPQNGGPNPNPPPCAGGNWAAWCTPTSAANIIGYWEDRRGQAISDGAIAPASGLAWPNWPPPNGPAYQDYQANGRNRGAVPAGTPNDLGWYMDTNRAGDPAQGNPGNCAAPGPHIGTYAKDISRPGLGLNKFFVARGGVALWFRAVTQGLAYADPGAVPLNNVAAAWNKIGVEIRADRPLLLCFTHWNISSVAIPPIIGANGTPEGLLNWTYYKFDPQQPGDIWGNGEVWETIDPNNPLQARLVLGHSVTAVGYIVAGAADDIGPVNGMGPTNWVIVHDNANGTPRNVAVPFTAASPWSSLTTIRNRRPWWWGFLPSETVDGGAEAGRSASLDLDDADQPHIGYVSVANPGTGMPQHVRYATKAAGAWTITPVDTGYNCVGGVSLMQYGGVPHMAYCGSNNAGCVGNYDLRRAYLGGPSWTAQTVTAAAGFSGPALAFDNSGQLRIAFPASAGFLRLAFLNFGFGQTWQFSTIDPAGGAFIDMAIDSNNAVHVSYSDGDRLKYANGTGQFVWSTCVVEDLPLTVGQYSSIALGSDGRRAISHYTFNNNYEGRIAESNGLTPCSWMPTAFESNTAQGSTCIRYDSLDQPVIAYWDGCPGNPPHACLKLARKIDGAWSIQTVLDAGSALSNFVPYLSMDLDSNDNPHIAFHGPEVKNLRYAKAVYVGDVDGDGCVDLNDKDLLVSLLLDPSSLTVEQQAAADCNGDGAVNGRDIQCILDLLLD